MASAGALFPTGIAPIVAMQLLVSTAIKPNLNVCMTLVCGLVKSLNAEDGTRWALGRREDWIDPLLGDGSA